ncbi:hypothetical protein [Alicyclobacillus sp.]|uniref:hypothetical protein n=1 Tax=Alicyclobacillus sp. TaxID=61169 RepID=UPI0025C43F3E|nr:hypothetical protein [Alicyclobacillus sp.]MCL6515636.1 hypothetical protein [Alicyclobacillus sp.]
MMDRTRRYRRLLAVNRSLEQVRSSALRRSQREREHASAALDEARRALAEALGWRDGCRTGADLLLWHEYTEALTARVRHRGDRLAAAETALEMERSRMQEAHREVKRWELAVEAQVRLEHAATNARRARELEDHIQRAAGRREG